MQKRCYILLYSKNDDVLNSRSTSVVVFVICFHHLHQEVMFSPQSVGWLVCVHNNATITGKMLVQIQDFIFKIKFMDLDGKDPTYLEA